MPTLIMPARVLFLPSQVLRIRLGAHQEHQDNHVARATDRTKVSADVIQLAAHEEDPAPQQDMSESDASDSDGSESASDSEQNDPPSSLVAEAEQYELMQLAYAAVGKDFTGKEDLIGAKYSKLLKLEMVPERWPLARLSFSLQTLCGSSRPRAGGMLLGSSSHTFFCLDAAWLNEGSLSGRSPFCQRKLSEESQIHWKCFSAKATILKQTTKKHQPHCSLPESAGAGGCSLFLGRLDQGLVGNAESTHVNRPKGKATLVP